MLQFSESKANAHDEIIGVLLRHTQRQSDGHRPVSTGLARIEFLQPILFFCFVLFEKTILSLQQSSFTNKSACLSGERQRNDL